MYNRQAEDNGGIRVREGCFISLEGTDGSGKSTQLRKIQEYFSDRDIDFFLIREPGGTSIGEKIRKIILDPANCEMDSMCEMMLYAASRAQLIREVVIPKVKEGKVVICDRFVDSSIVYQGIARGIGIDTVWEVNKHAINGCMPNLTLFFDIHPKEAGLRMKKSNRSLDRLEMEDEEFHVKVYEGYLKLANLYPERFKRIDSSKSIDETFESVKVHLDNILLKAN